MLLRLLLLQSPCRRCRRSGAVAASLVIHPSEMARAKTNTHETHKHFMSSSRRLLPCAPVVVLRLVSLALSVFVFSSHTLPTTHQKSNKHNKHSQTEKKQKTNSKGSGLGRVSVGGGGGGGGGGKRGETTPLFGSIYALSSVARMEGNLSSLRMDGASTSSHTRNSRCCLLAAWLVHFYFHFVFVCCLSHMCCVWCRRRLLMR